MLRIFTLLLGLLVLPGAVLSETYYIAPLNTAVSGTPDGSESLPFPSIEAAFKSGKVNGGDTLLLKDGAYGAVIIKANADFAKPVTITSQNDKKAHFDSILLSGTTRNLTLKNLSVWPRNPEKGAAYLVRSYNTTSGITIDGLDIRSEQNAQGFMQWDAAKWEARKFNGIFLQGPRNLVIRSTLTGVRHGIMVMDDSQIINNIVNGYNGDGLRAFSRSIVRGNRVSNCVKTDANHADGFQSFSTDGLPVTGLVIDSNIIIEWTGAPDNPVRCKLQGIGLFDGFYDNLTIVNNVISASQYHGISVYGARGAKIINNTVVNSLGLTGIYPYIAVHPRKGGGDPTDVLVANNVAMSIQGKASAENGVVFKSNSVIGTPSVVFENPAAFDYRPKASSGYIDTADPAVAPETDVNGHKRPGGALPDRGAYEIQGDGAVLPPGIVEPVLPGTTDITSPSVTPPTTTVTERTKTGTTVTVITSPGGSKRIMLTKQRN